MSIDGPTTIPAKLLLPLLRDLLLHGVAVDRVLECPGGRLPLAPLLRGEVIALDRRDFVHAYGLSTLLLEQAVCRSRAKSKNRGKALEAFLSFVVAADTLQEACKRAAEFNTVLEERGYSLNLRTSAKTAQLVIDFNPSMAHSPLSLISASTIFYYNFFSWLTASPIDLLKVSLSCPQSPDGNPSIEILDVPIIYNGNENCLIFNAHNLARKVVRSPKDITGLVDFIAYDPLFFIRSATPMSNRIRALLADIVERGKNLPDSLWIAQQLDISPSTLTRRLRHENTSFLKLKSECQEETAKLLLRQGALTVQEIATRMGFVDTRSFRRAFLGWTGVLPSIFREQSQMPIQA